MLFAIAFVILFTIGGFSGLMLAIVPADFQYQDTYFVVAHFHYVLCRARCSRSWRRLITGCRSGPATCTNETGQVHFWLSTSGSTCCSSTAFPGVGRHAAPHPRLRLAVYRLELQHVSTVGAFLFGFSQLFFLYNVIRPFAVARRRRIRFGKARRFGMDPGFAAAVPPSPPRRSSSRSARIQKRGQDAVGVNVVPRGLAARKAGWRTGRSVAISASLMMTACSDHGRGDDGGNSGSFARRESADGATPAIGDSGDVWLGFAWCRCTM